MLTPTLFPNGKEDAMHDYLNDLSVVVSQEGHQLQESTYAKLPATDLGRLITAAVIRELASESDESGDHMRGSAIAHSGEITSFLYQLKHQPERSGVALIEPGTQLLAKCVLDSIQPLLSAYRRGIPLEDIEEANLRGTSALEALLENSE